MSVLRMSSFTAIAVSLALCACLSGCGNGGNNMLPAQPGGVPQADQNPVTNTRTATGYGLSVFVTAPKTTMHPDSIVMLKGTIYIGYQNTGDVKDGSDPTLTNTIIGYNFNGVHLESPCRRCPCHRNGAPMLVPIRSTACWSCTSLPTGQPSRRGPVNHQKRPD